MEKIRVFTLLLLCVSLLTVCKAEEEMEGQDHMASVKKRALPDCGQTAPCGKHKKCKCPEDRPDCAKNKDAWFQSVCQVLPYCGATQPCDQETCKCEEGKDCGIDPHAKYRLFAKHFCQ